MQSSFVYRIAHPRRPFTVSRLIGRSKKGAYHLEIMTPKGPITAWISKRHMDYYVYHRDGQVVREAWIEEWLAGKIGLLLRSGELRAKSKKKGGE